jgi:hypothetical protein
MAARATRALRAAQGACSLGPLPQVPLAEDELDEALAAVGRGAYLRRRVLRQQPDGPPALIAAGGARQGSRRGAVAGPPQQGTARRFGVRSRRPAQAAATALRARVSPALAPLDALTQRGRGTKRLAAVPACRQAVGAIAPRERVEACVWRRFAPPPVARAVPAARARPARGEHGPHAPVAVRVAAAALEAAGRRLGWRV